jgi:formylglycine-generating enzyme required for sulfatase activity
MARDQVFISYSHKDKDWLERLQTMLVPLQWQGKLKLWADTDIRPGQRWKEEIKQALAEAAVAVLLVSPDFLASRFIHEYELPPLLDAATKEGLTILWVPVRPSLYEETVIGEYQAAHDPKTPLSTLPVWQQEVALTEIARTIKLTQPTEILSSSPPAQSTNISNKQTLTPPIESKPFSKLVPPLYIEPGLSAKPTRSTLPVIQSIYGWSAYQVQELQQQTTLALGLRVEFRDTLKDGSPGSEMVVIPAGEFLIGSPEDEPERQGSEGPQHKVVIAKPFAIGRYAVTFEEYDRFCEATRREKPDDQGWGRGRRPVISVAWEDVVAYCAWLSQETGAAYRLPSEAEWEYACRAGATTAYWWGDEIDTTRANYNGNYVYRNGPKGEYRQQTVPVDTFQPNPFGLYQVHGNVWEWVADVWRNDYQDAPHDGSAQTMWPVRTEQRTGTRNAISEYFWNMPYGGHWWTGSDPPQETYSYYTVPVDDKSAGHVMRGGSWSVGPGGVRGAARTNWLPHDWLRGSGFRLARTFP